MTTTTKSFPSKQAAHNFEHVLNALHDAIVPRPGGSRWNSRDRIIQPMGSALAGEQIGHNDAYVRKLLNMGHDKHEPTIRHLICWMDAGMDTSVLDVLDRIAGRIAIPLPDIHEHSDLQHELINLLKEMGDIGAALQASLMSESGGVSGITKRESVAIDQEIDEAIAALCTLRAVVDALAK